MATSQMPSTDHSREEEKIPTHESEEFISSLPREKGWRTSLVYQYQGFWYASDMLPGVISCQKRFQALLTDLLLVTPPKCGTVWLKALAFAIVNRSRYSTHTHPLLTKCPHDLVPYWEIELYRTNANPDLTHIPSPRLFATHLPYISLPESVHTSKCRIVYLCRNPRDTFVSLWHFMNKLKANSIGGAPISAEEGLDMFCKGTTLYGPFWEHVLGYWKESLERPERILFLTYEEMKHDPNLVQLKRLAEFLGYPFSPEEERQGVVEKISKMCSFENLSTLEANISGRSIPMATNNICFRKGTVGDWVNHLTPPMIDRLDRLTEEKLGSLGLTFSVS